MLRSVLVKIVGICAIFASIPSTQAQNLGLKALDEVKQWRFDTQHGEVTLKLSSYAAAGKPANTVLSFGQSTTTNREMVEFIRVALGEMPSLGYDPRALEMISTSLNGSEMEDPVNDAVQRSGVWHSCIGRKYCYKAQPVANRFLSAANAYDQLADVLHSYGLQITSVTTDEMACGAQKPAASDAHSEKKATKVSCSGLIHIVVQKEQ